MVVYIAAVAPPPVSCQLLFQADKPNAAAHMSKRPASDFTIKIMFGIGRGGKYMQQPLQIICWVFLEFLEGKTQNEKKTGLIWDKVLNVGGWDGVGPNFSNL